MKFGELEITSTPYLTNVLENLLSLYIQPSRALNILFLWQPQS
jgi:hypothetical protein